MNVKDITRYPKAGFATITLSTDELVVLDNILYKTSDEILSTEEKRETFHSLSAQILAVKELVKEGALFFSKPLERMNGKKKDKKNDEDLEVDKEFKKDVIERITRFVEIEEEEMKNRERQRNTEKTTEHYMPKTVYDNLQHDNKENIRALKYVIGLVRRK